MRRVLFVLGIFIFPSGIGAIPTLINRSLESHNFLSIIYSIPLLIALGFLGMIIYAAKFGWPEKDLKGISKLSLNLIGISVILTGLLGDFRNTLFFGVFDVQVIGLWLAPYAMIGVNVLGWKLYPRYPRKMFWVALGLANLLIFSVMAYFIFAEDQSELLYRSPAYRVLQLLARLIQLGLLTGFAIRNFELKKNWEQYVASGESGESQEDSTTANISEQVLINRLQNNRLAIRTESIQLLKTRNTPAALDGIARAVEKSPPFYLFHTESVAASWKKLKTVGKEALSDIKAKNEPFLNDFPNVYCARDWVWAKKYATPGGTEYVMCPECKNHDALHKNVENAVAILGSDESQHQRGNTFYVSVWDDRNQRVLPAEITGMEIITGNSTLNYDWAISAFVQDFENKLSNKGRKIPVRIDHPEKLSPNARAILQSISA